MSGTGASAASGAGLWKKAVSALLVYFSLIPTDSAASQCFMQQYSLCTISLTKYVFSEFLAMKLMTHNFLTSKFLKGVVNGYPLLLVATKKEVNFFNFYKYTIFSHPNV